MPKSPSKTSSKTPTKVATTTAKVTAKVASKPRAVKTVPTAATELGAKLDCPEYRFVREKTFFSWLFSVSGDISIRRDAYFFPLGGVRLKRFRTASGNKYGFHIILWSVELGLKIWAKK